MTTIYKAVLDFRQADVLPIQMPEGSEIMTIKSQYGIPTMWYLCDTEEPMETRKFRALTTGQDIPDDLEGDYINTVTMIQDQYVLHIFEIYD